MAAFVLVAIASGAGCDLVTALSGGAGLRCENHEACPHGHVCTAGICSIPDRVAQLDASLDAARPDSMGPGDAGSDGARHDVAAVDRVVADMIAADLAVADRAATDQTVADQTVADQHVGRDRGWFDRAAADDSVGDAFSADVADGATPGDSGQPDQSPSLDGALTCETAFMPSIPPLDCGGRGHLANLWDLTQHDLTLDFTYNATGIIDQPATARTFGQIGVRPVGGADWVPSNGVWLATDIDGVLDTLDPDPAGAPDQDLDDHLMLERRQGGDEYDYDLPAVPPTPYASHRFWFDRDGVTAIEAQQAQNVDGGNYNTHGIYHVVFTLRATDATHGTAFLTINGLTQGFEVDDNWETVELTPAGMTWSGDMTKMQVYYGLACVDVASTIAYESIVVSGCLAE